MPETDLAATLRRQDPARLSFADLVEQRDRMRSELRSRLGNTSESEALLNWIEEDEAELSQRERPQTPTGTTERRGSGWMTPDGQAVRVYGPDEPLAESRADAGPWEDEGHYFRALINGAENESERRALSSGTDAAGGILIPETISRRLIDRARAQLRVGQAGARTVALSGSSLTIVKIESDPVASWRAEGGNVAESNGPSFSGFTFKPRSLALRVKAPYELLQDAANIGHAVADLIAKAMATELDRVAIWGSGVAPEPAGLTQSVDVPRLSMGTNGAAVANWDVLVDAFGEIQDRNHPNPTAAILAPRTARAFAKLKDSTDQPLRRPQMVEGLSFLPTTAVPIDQAHGTATDASSIILGGFSHLLLGIRHGLRLEMLKSSDYEDRLMLTFLAYLRADIAVEQPEAFAIVEGITP